MDVASGATQPEYSKMTRLLIYVDQIHSVVYVLSLGYLDHTSSYLPHIIWTSDNGGISFKNNLNQERYLKFSRGNLCINC